MKAFTLIEILISAVILSLVILAVFFTFNIGETNWRSDMGRLDVHQQARQAMHGMIREIRQSSSSNVTLTNSGAQIEFYIPDVSNSITYYLNDSGQIIREHPAGSIRPIASDISRVCFCWDSITDSCGTSCLDVMLIHIEASKSVRQQMMTFNLTEKVKLRN